MAGEKEIKARILDAAEQCLLESEPGARIHAAVAERAGVSRPTVYKYVGDQEAIVAAILHRDINRMHEAAEHVLTRRGSLRERFVETIVFVVGYARSHALLQKGLRENPAAILPWFTVNAGPIIEMGIAFVGPHIKQAIADGDFPDVEPRVVVEWCCRLTLSLITTPGTVRLDDPDLLRRYVEDLLDIGSVIS
ncbi:AcrR family transcriptional regulator [Kibdelosporangium banguiense]|uniref:AcrR family transcriptional regulator n=1 Tax=Kibdelosporangium banguiense TaxID=1365924 RepID=A0ABS4TJV4_9PSEU|nr:TetR/AcrR family transcriptional regulator [Kibdelosporangium banguiense]MBP2324305.1 AcrR family transcriptional regulator [Kibdelosporangium banguiense]